MSIHILVDGDVLARSRFAITPALEVIDALRARDRPPSTPPGTEHHTLRWNRRAAARLSASTTELLHALVPTDHDYTPDFLTPRPSGHLATISHVVESIAATPDEVVDHHLDIGLDGRPVRPEVAAQFASEEAYRAWRRPVPDALARLLPGGPRAVAEEAAHAVEAWYRHAVSEDWPLVRSVVETDIADRGARISAHGWAAMLEDLGDVTWTGSELRIERPYEGVVDWADDGVLFIPSTARTGRVQFCAERPDSPLLIYTARGTAALWSGRRADPPREAPEGVDLIGRGRRAILDRLDRPRTTRDLSRLDGRSESTISYHLGVLTRAGLVDKRRSGGSVAYHRTPLADSFVGAGAGPTEVDRG